MNQTIRQKQAVLQVLRDRLSMSTSEMYQMIGQEEPIRPLRFTLVPLGANKFDVIERSTGLSRGAQAGHDCACRYAQQLEKNADVLDSVGVSVRRFGRLMLRWVGGFAVLLGAFAFFGAQ
ncbi:hypothetical protein [Pseudomonas sp. CLCA07]